MLTAGWRRPDGSRGPGAVRGSHRSVLQAVSYVDSAYGDKRQEETVIRNHLGFLVLSEAGSLRRGRGGGHRLQAIQSSQLGSTRP